MVFEGTPDESVYNVLGVVHGGLVCAVADTVAALAVRTTLEAGVGYTSIDLNVSYTRPVTRDSGALRAVGTVVKPGRRVAFSQAEIFDGAGQARRHRHQQLPDHAGRRLTGPALQLAGNSKKPAERVNRPSRSAMASAAIPVVGQPVCLRRPRPARAARTDAGTARRRATAPSADRPAAPGPPPAACRSDWPAKYLRARCR